MTTLPAIPLTAFDGARLLASGPAEAVVAAALARRQQNPAAALLVFDDRSGEVLDLNHQDDPAQVLRRVLGRARPEPTEAEQAAAPPPAEARGRGRPRLGVIAREITLLPRHWDWLASQPGSASVVLRRLVDEARKRHALRDRQRAAQQGAYRVMLALAGDRPRYEDALRALFAADRPGFDTAMAGWPADIRAYAQRVAAPAFELPAPPAPDAEPA